MILTWCVIVLSCSYVLTDSVPEGIRPRLFNSDFDCKLAVLDLTLLLDAPHSGAPAEIVDGIMEFVDNFNMDNIVFTLIAMYGSFRRPEIIFEKQTMDRTNLYRKLMSWQSVPGFDNNLLGAMELFFRDRTSEPLENKKGTVDVLFVLSNSFPNGGFQSLEPFFMRSLHEDIRVFFLYGSYFTRYVLDEYYYHQTTEFFYRFEEPSEFKLLMKDSRKRICKVDLPSRALCEETDVDVVILLEVPSPRFSVNSRDLITSCVNILRHFSSDHLRASLVTFSDEPTVHFYLNNKQDAVNLLQNLTVDDLPDTGEGSGNLQKAVALMSAEVLQEQRGKRQEARTYIVALTMADYLQLDIDLNNQTSELFVLYFGKPLVQSDLSGHFNQNNVISGSVSDIYGSVSMLMSKICPVCDEANGWYHYDGSCYHGVLVSQSIKWLDARDRCKDMTSVLGNVKGADHEDFYFKILPYHLSGTVAIGLSADSSHHPGKFKDIYKWEDGMPLLYSNWESGKAYNVRAQACVQWHELVGWRTVSCWAREVTVFVCMKPANIYSRVGAKETPRLSPNVSWRLNPGLFTTCKNGEVTSRASICDGKPDCRDGSDEANCSSTCLPNQFSCRYGGCVSLNVYCDGFKDCADGSDENECEIPACRSDQWRCASGQCVEAGQRCDLLYDCLDDSDESGCDSCKEFTCADGSCIPFSWVDDSIGDCSQMLSSDDNQYMDYFQYDTVKANLNYSSVRSFPPNNHSRFFQSARCYRIPDMFGKTYIPFKDEWETCGDEVCAEGFFKCPQSYCIPVFSVCNGVNDCPNGEDEVKCSNFSCKDHYRCQGETQCIHPSQLCDGLRHCPRGDDERVCFDQCPSFCECEGALMSCSYSGSNDPLVFPNETRRLDLTDSNLENTSLNFSNLRHLTVLLVSNCRLQTVAGILSNLTNVRMLNLSLNQLTTVHETDFLDLVRLRTLDLSYNLNLKSIQSGSFAGLANLEDLILSHTKLSVLPVRMFWGMRSLIYLDLSNNELSKIENKAFDGLSSLDELDIGQNDIRKFDIGVFDGLDNLQLMNTDRYELCCESVRPPSLPSRACNSSQSVISSCDDLLGENILRIFLWIIGVCAVAGNVFILVYRFFFDKQSLKRGYGIFVINMGFSDFLMGIYMMIIGTADLNFRGSYVFHDYSWRHGAMCKTAGFLSTLSSEASCIFITLITADRFLAIKFPFGQIRFTPKSASVAAALTWVVAVVLATIPLLSQFQHWNLYTKNSMCVALPLSAERFPGWEYSTAIFVGLNFALFMLIGIGQFLIYREVSASSKVRSTKSSDQKVARNLALVVLSDFLCWFPVGIMGILAQQGVDFGGPVYAWTAVLVLPINSALNPVLYTIPSILEARKNRTRKKEATNKTTSLDSTGSRAPNAGDSRVYVGRPSSDMVSLKDFLAASDIRTDVKKKGLTCVVATLKDLHIARRVFRPCENQFPLYISVRDQVTSFGISRT